MSGSKRGFFRGAMDRMIEARRVRANHYVNATLLMLDDETLRARGYDRKSLEKNSGSRILF